VFEDSLFATNGHRSPQRGVAAVLSFGVQAVFLSALVLIPLFYTDAIPLGALKSYVEIPAPPGQRSQPPPQQARRPTQPHQSNMENGQIVVPIVIPPHAAILHEDPSDVAPAPSGDYIIGATGPGGGNRNAMFRDLMASNMHPVAPVPMNIQTRPTPVSKGVIEGLLISRITPVYPKIAILTHQQGTVLLHAIIGRDGTIQNLQVISGPPLLIKAALDAVERWRYRPYLLNNEPVEVETQITVNFTLGG